MAEKSDKPTPETHAVFRLSEEGRGDLYYLPRDDIERVLIEADYGVDYETVKREWTHSMCYGGDSQYLREVLDGCGTNVPPSVTDTTLSTYDTVAVHYAGDEITVSTLQERGKPLSINEIPDESADHYADMFKELIELVDSGKTYGNELNAFDQMWQNHGLPLTPEELVELDAVGSELKEAFAKARTFTGDLYAKANERSKKLEKSEGLER